MKLSILIPVYNERRTVEAVLHLVAGALPSVAKELVIVDDGSTDGTRELLQQLIGPPIPENQQNSAAPVQFGENCLARLVFHQTNSGKGRALQTAMSVCSGDIIVIQDADLEYDPADWQAMYALIADRKVADVVFGSRFSGGPHRSLYYHHYLANRLISTLFNIFFNQTLTDIEACYKMFTREVLRSLRLKCNDFGIEIEVSAQIAAARKWRIYEIGIHHYPRTYEQGKKINWRDGLKALWYLVRYRISPGN